MMIGRYAEARGLLDTVTNLNYTDLKNRLERNLAAREHPPATNAPAVAASPATNPFSAAPPPPANLSTNLPVTPPSKPEP